MLEEVIRLATLYPSISAVQNGSTAAIFLPRERRRDAVFLLAAGIVAIVVE